MVAGRADAQPYPGAERGGAVRLREIRVIRRRTFRSASDEHHFIGNAKAIISSLVTTDPVSPPPVLTTVTNWRPSALLYVIGVVSTDDGSLISHSFSPVAVAKARNLKSSVPPTKVRPPAVSTTPPELGRPVSCMPGGNASETPSVLR